MTTASDTLPMTREVTFTRMLNAPRALVWAAWTEPKHMAQWWGPRQFTNPVCELDVRVGGTRLVCMEVTTPNGPMQMWFTGEYREVIKNKRLVYTDSMSNPNGDIIDPSDLGMPPGHPTTTEVRVELEDLGGGHIFRAHAANRARQRPAGRGHAKRHHPRAGERRRPRHRGPPRHAARQPQGEHRGHVAQP